MPPHRLEVADVFREYGGEYSAAAGLSAAERRVLCDIVACRTAALGGQVKRCDRCAHEEFFYKSCGNRHCPKCQGAARARWLDDRAKDLLEVPYFHLVFTLPHELGPIALQNRRLIYGLLFRAASETLLQITRDPRHLGAEIGFLAVLHTWGQRLDLHPHVHCIVPGGGISLDGRRWLSSREDFFLPVKVLSRVFRGKFLDHLRKAFRRGEVSLAGDLENLREERVWALKLTSIRRRDWVVYAKPPFGGARQVLKYLARYTHRVAISNQRLVDMDDGRVTFRWKDYADGGRRKAMTLEANEFIRRFLLHVLPSGFQRIRHYGFLANRVRRSRLERCRTLLGQELPCEADIAEKEPPIPVEAGSIAEERSGWDVCPACKEGRLVLVAELKANRSSVRSLLEPERIDSS